MRLVRNVCWFLYKVFAVYSILVFALIFWVPSSHWLPGFMMMSFPLVVILNALCVFLFFLIDGKRILTPLFILLLSLIFLPRTYNFKKGNAESAANPKKAFTVLSYNVHEFFLNPRQGIKPVAVEENAEIVKMRDWIQVVDADVLCLPEYRNVDRHKVLNITNYLKKNGYKFSRFTKASDRNKNYDYEGLGLFSKHPIIAAEIKSFGSLNGIINADIKINKDTIRVIAVHLSSLTLKLNELVAQKNVDGVKAEGRITLRHIRKGFVEHASEFDNIRSFIKSSPYPVIVCGDFNETAYSYIYGKMRGLLTNAFEEKGTGFGFTFNKLPYFIRIDHQFYNAERLRLLEFETVHSIKYSDHYPLIGRYEVKK